MAQRSNSALVPLHITLPRELMEWLRAEADKKFITRTALIAQLVAAERERTRLPGQRELPFKGESDAARR